MGEAKRRQAKGQGPTRSGSGKGWGIGLLVLGVVIVVGSGLWWLMQPPEPTSTALPDVSDDTPAFPAARDEVGVSIGDPEAPVVVREFADYQCPACARFAPATHELREQYVESGQVRFVFFDLPLRMHDNARPAAMAARCAGDQSAYWPMHERLFEQQGEWDTNADPQGTFTRYAGEMGLDERRFRRCMETRLHAETIDESVGLARQLQVSSTPTVYVDNIPLSRPGWSQLQAVVERELNDRN
ncbi:thioredoxin-like protein [Tamilnaduibacter salinus]|uniref:Thioredoxin-like protein n=1 Tax=Tamilnaduibacter salinus TaxID=1484056 RepID=A0A2U1CVM8_9GAMM|nr:DsbA family protein [Tamilnaduibacter salinus]PVY75795.1 thioredoxin-like protein [Tamilnaduibacter salinus]